MTEAVNYKSALIKGAFWTVGARWSIKGIGFLNTAIMARLLVPADYGIVAMAMLVVGLIQAIVDFGASTALLRKGTLDTDYIDSAWTLCLLQSVGIGVLVLAVSPLATLYFEEPRVQGILWAMAVCVPLNAASNIGLALAQKDLQFSLDFRVSVASRLLSVAVTLVAGFLLRDFRALVIGICSNYVAQFVLSYVMHPYRPRWNIRRIPEIWKVTKWLLLAGVGAFLMRKSDEVIAARIGGAHDYGIYNVGADLGSLPIGELGPAMLRAFLPVLSSIKDDAERTSRAVLKIFAAANSITLPIGSGVAAIAEPMTLVILGPKWTEAGVFVAGFALVATAQFVMHPLNNLLLLRGLTRLQNRIVWVEVSVFIFAVALLTPQMHLMGLLAARAAGAAANLGTTAYCTCKYTSVTLKDIMHGVWRPLSGAVLMHWLVAWVVQCTTEPVVQLLAGIATGVMTYAVWLVCSWLMSGRPEGLESTVLDLIGKTLNIKIPL